MSVEHVRATTILERGGASGGGVRQRGRQRLARRVIEAMIDEALEHAGAGPHQRLRILKARNRVFAMVGEWLEGRGSNFFPRVEREIREQVERHFVTVPIGPRSIEADRPRTAHPRVSKAIASAMTEAHAVLTAAQHLAIAEYVRTNLPTGIR